MSLSVSIDPKLAILKVYVPMYKCFFLQFVRQVVWQSSSRGFSQISLGVKEENFKNQDSSYILTRFWNILFKYGNFFLSYHEDFSLYFAKTKKNPLYHLVCHQDVKICQKETLICMLFKGDFRQGSKVLIPMTSSNLIGRKL